MNQRVIAIQTGARHNYAIPRALHSGGVLEAFYTDLCADGGIASSLRKVCPQKMRKGSIRNLLDRRIPDGIEDKLHTFDGVAITHLFSSIVSEDNFEEKQQRVSKFEQTFGRAAVRKGLKKATHVIAISGDEGSIFLKHAREKGVHTLSDMVIHPDIYTIVRSEQRIHSDIEDPVSDKVIGHNERRLDKILEVTDTFLVPSQFVLSGLVARGVKESFCKLLPYTVSEDWFDVVNEPEEGRVLFVGTAGLRKGIHTLGMAAEKLKSNHIYKFRIAGGATSTVKNHPYMRNLNFLGRISRADIKREYAAADIFVLPSLAEGSAGVIYEALASGLPVITTDAAGSFVADGVNGFIVPCRDSDILAERIEQLVSDRALRACMARNAKESAKDFTYEVYSKKLLSYIQ